MGQSSRVSLGSGNYQASRSTGQPMLVHNLIRVRLCIALGMHVVRRFRLMYPPFLPSELALFSFCHQVKSSLSPPHRASTISPWLTSNDRSRQKNPAATKTMQNLDQLSLGYCTLSAGSQPEHTLPVKLQAIASAGFQCIELGFPDLVSYAQQELGSSFGGESDWDALEETAKTIRHKCEELGLVSFTCGCGVDARPLTLLICLSFSAVYRYHGSIWSLWWIRNGPTKTRSVRQSRGLVQDPQSSGQSPAAVRHQQPVRCQ